MITAEEAKELTKTDIDKFLKFLDTEIKTAAICGDYEILLYNTYSENLSWIVNPPDNDLTFIMLDLLKKYGYCAYVSYEKDHLTSQQYCLHISWK